MRVHVTGAGGFLGRELIRSVPTATTERVDVRDARAVTALFDRVRPAVVIHTAYRQDGPDAWEITVDGSTHVAEAAAAVGARLVHMSTDVVFDGRKGAPYTELDAPNPITDYGRAKAEAERRVATIAPTAAIVRTSLILGGPGHEPSKHERATADPAAVFYDDEIRSPIQVSDLAAALLELASTTHAGPIHIAGADALSRADVAELIVGRPVRRAPAPASRPLDCSLDSTLARSLLRTRLRGAREFMRA